MLPQGCPEWEYDNLPEKTTIIQREIKFILSDLRSGNMDTLENVSDTRHIHFRLFRQLVPKGFTYYAGHYRGEDFFCLKHYEVEVRYDSRVGYPARQVSASMFKLAELLRNNLSSLDEGMKLPNAQLPLKHKIYYIVAFASRIFELFLRIHPYANGNGHAARFCVVALLGRYNLWPKSWPIDPRPADPPYTGLIVTYRNGHKAPLEEFIMQTLIA